MVASFRKRVLPSSAAADVESAVAEVPDFGETVARSHMKPPAVVSPPVQEKFGPVQTFVAISEYKVGQVYDVPVNAVNSNPLNPRYVYTTVAVSEMARSLAQHGQRVSATGYLDEAGALNLIEGETRLRGTRAAGLPTLRIEIKARPVSDQALYEEARAANVERREQTALDDAMRWKELVSKKIYPNQRALGHALGLSDDVVSRTVSLTSMSPRLVSAVAEYPALLTLRMLVALREYAEVRGDDATLELIFEVAKQGMGAREVIARRKAAQKPPVKRPRSSREVVAFGGGSGEMKIFDEDGRVELSLKGLTPEASDQLTTAIRALLSATSEGTV